MTNKCVYYPVASHLKFFISYLIGLLFAGEKVHQYPISEKDTIWDKGFHVEKLNG